MPKKTVEDSLENLLTQLEDPGLTEAEISRLEKKIKILQGLQQ